MFKKTGVFVTFYLLGMIPTYILPYMGSNSAALQAAGVAAEEGMLGGAFLIHLACLLFLICITWIRSGAESVRWIVTFPILAAVFDMVPVFSLIPFAPTVFHIVAIVLGARGRPVVAVHNEPANE